MPQCFLQSTTCNRLSWWGAGPIDPGTSDPMTAKQMQTFPFELVDGFLSLGYEAGKRKTNKLWQGGGGRLVNTMRTFATK